MAAASSDVISRCVAAAPALMLKVPWRSASHKSVLAKRLESLGTTATPALRSPSWTAGATSAARAPKKASDFLPGQRQPLKGVGSAMAMDAVFITIGLREIGEVEVKSK